MTNPTSIHQFYHYFVSAFPLCRKVLDDVPPDLIFIVMAIVCLLLIGIIAHLVPENYANLEPVEGLCPVGGMWGERR